LTQWSTNESLIIETKQGNLCRPAGNRLYIVYPVDGLVLADSPLGYINQGDQKKGSPVFKFQDYLLSPETQSQS